MVNNVITANAGATPKSDAKTANINDASLDASALFFIVDRLEDAVCGGEDERDEALAMARVARQMAKNWTKICGRLGPPCNKNCPCTGPGLLSGEP